MSSQSKLPQLLLQFRILPQKTVEKLISKVEHWGGRFVTLLLEEGWLTEEQLLTLFQRMGIPAVSQEGLRAIPREVLQKVPIKLCELYELIPFAQDASRNTLKVAMSDPTEYNAVRAVQDASGMTVEPYAAPISVIRWAIRFHYDPQNLGPIQGRWGGHRPPPHSYPPRPDQLSPSQTSANHLRVGAPKRGYAHPYHQEPNPAQNSQYSQPSHQFDSANFSLTSLLSINSLPESDGVYQFSSPQFTQESPTVGKSTSSSLTALQSFSSDNSSEYAKLEELFRLRRELNKLKFELQNTIQELKDLMVKRFKEERIVIRGLLELLVRKDVITKDEIVEILKKYQDK